jgi:hypothetical protein
VPCATSPTPPPPSPTHAQPCPSLHWYPVAARPAGPDGVRAVGGGDGARAAHSIGGGLGDDASHGPLWATTLLSPQLGLVVASPTPLPGQPLSVPCPPRDLQQFPTPARRHCVPSVSGRFSDMLQAIFQVFQLCQMFVSIVFIRML